MVLPTDSLGVLVGASGSGPSWWAHTHFLATQVVSSDHCRALVSDSEETQTANREAFAVFYTILRQRLALGRLTVADSTGLEAFSRARMVAMAAERGRPAHAVVFPAPLERLLAQNAARARRVPDAVLRRHAERLEALLGSGALLAEGFAAVHLLDDAARGAPVVLVAPPPPPPPATPPDAAG